MEHNCHNMHNMHNIVFLHVMHVMLHNMAAGSITWHVMERCLHVLRTVPPCSANGTHHVVEHHVMEHHVLEPAVLYSQNMGSETVLWRSVKV